MTKEDLLEEIKELKKENRQLLHKVRRRINRLELIAEREKTPLSPAVNKFKDIEETIPNAFANPILEGLSEDNQLKLLKKQLSDLKSLRRDVKYVDMLKSSSVRGYRNYLKDWQSVEDILIDENTEDTKLGLTKAEFFEAYDKLVEQRQLAQNYKYDVFNAIVNEYLLDKDKKPHVDYIVKNLVDLIDVGTSYSLDVNESLAFSGGKIINLERETKEGVLNIEAVRNGKSIQGKYKRPSRRNTSVYKKR